MEKLFSKAAELTVEKGDTELEWLGDLRNCQWLLHWEWLETIRGKKKERGGESHTEKEVMGTGLVTGTEVLDLNCYETSSHKWLTRLAKVIGINRKQDVSKRVSGFFADGIQSR